LLFKTTFTLAILITIVYACGFLFMLIGQPVAQYAAVLDLIRSGVVAAWISLVVVLAAERNNAASEAREQAREEQNRRREAEGLAQAIRRRENPGAA
jgi:hypothetical protein